jgi:hypothetical protein
MLEEVTDPANASVAIEEVITPQTLILHYHIFKNAGSSVDRMLKENFAGDWAEQEFDIPMPKAGPAFPCNAGAVAAYLAANPQLRALSSHTAVLPLPELPGRAIFPILFLRHPVDRLKSAYIFERQQKADTFGAKLAKAHNFSGYLRELLRHEVNRSARNFQTFRLAFNEPAEAGTEVARATRVLQNFAFVGLVEAYDASLARLQAALAPRLPNFQAVPFRVNVTQKEERPLADKLAAIRTEIGGTLYDELLAANANDLILHAQLRAAYHVS